MKKKELFVFTVFLAFAVFDAKAEVQEQNGMREVRRAFWNGYNNPKKFPLVTERKLSVLPTEGSAETAGLAWPGYWWANDNGGVAYRWQSGSPQNFEYTSPSLFHLRRMSQESINKLSPIEKFSIAIGDYSYRLRDKVWDQTRGSSKDWHGICHGVSSSSLYVKEPSSRVYENADGIKIPFASSDLKGLVAYYYAKVGEGSTTQVGRRCNIAEGVPLLRRSKVCNDVNAGAFHLIMANYLGNERRSFIADMDRYRQVWNHAAVSFDSHVARYSASVAGTSYRKVKVRTKIRYTGTVTASVNPILGTENALYSDHTYVYWLYLNNSGEIVGGKWESQDRPDFLWMPKRVKKFKGIWQNLDELVEVIE